MGQGVSALCGQAFPQHFDSMALRRHGVAPPLQRLFSSIPASAPGTGPRSKLPSRPSRARLGRAVLSPQAGGSRPVNWLKLQPGAGQGGLAADERSHVDLRTRPGGWEERSPSAPAFS